MEQTDSASARLSWQLALLLPPVGALPQSPVVLPPPPLVLRLPLAAGRLPLGVLRLQVAFSPAPRVGASPLQALFWLARKAFVLPQPSAWRFALLVGDGFLRPYPLPAPPLAGGHHRLLRAFLVRPRASYFVRGQDPQTIRYCVAQGKSPTLPSCQLGQQAHNRHELQLLRQLALQLAERAPSYCRPASRKRMVPADYRLFSARRPERDRTQYANRGPAR